MDNYAYDYQRDYVGDRGYSNREYPHQNGGGLRGGSVSHPPQDAQQWQAGQYRPQQHQQPWHEPNPQEARHRARSPAPARRGVYPEDRGHHGHGFHYADDPLRYPPVTPPPPPPPPRRASDDDSYSGQRNPRSSLTGQKPWMGKGISAAMKEELLSAAHSRLRRVGITMQDMEVSSEPVEYASVSVDWNQRGGVRHDYPGINGGPASTHVGIPNSWRPELDINDRRQAQQHQYPNNQSERNRGRYLQKPQDTAPGYPLQRDIRPGRVAAGQAPTNGTPTMPRPAPRKASEHVYANPQNAGPPRARTPPPPPRPVSRGRGPEETLPRYSQDRASPAPSSVYSWPSSNDRTESVSNYQLPQATARPPGAGPRRPVRDLTPRIPVPPVEAPPPRDWTPVVRGRNQHEAHMQGQPDAGGRQIPERPVPAPRRTRPPQPQNMPTFNPGRPSEPSLEESFERAVRVQSGVSSSTANSNGLPHPANYQQPRNGYITARPGPGYTPEDPRYQPKDPRYQQNNPRYEQKDPRYQQKDPHCQEDPRNSYQQFDDDRRFGYSYADGSREHSGYDYGAEDVAELRAQSSRCKPDFNVVVQKFSGAGQPTNVAQGACPPPRSYY